MKILNEIRWFFIGEDSDYALDIATYAVCLYDLAKALHLNSADYADTDVRCDKTWTKKLYRSIYRAAPLYVKPASLVLWLDAVMNKGVAKMLSLLDDLACAVDYEQFCLERIQWADETMLNITKTLSKIVVVLNDDERMQKISEKEYADLMQMGQTCYAQITEISRTHEITQKAYNDIKEAKIATLRKLYRDKYEDSLPQMFSMQCADHEPLLAEVVKCRAESCWALGGQESDNPSSISKIVFEYKQSDLMAMCGHDMDDFAELFGDFIRAICNPTEVTA